MIDRDIELFEAPKILGDVFESIMGAIFVDGGIEEVMRVYEHMLAPFILYVAKWSKFVPKEPKEELYLESTKYKIRPKLEIKGIFKVTLQQLNEIKNTGQALSELEEVKSNEDSSEDSQQQQCYMHECDVIYNNGSVMCTGFGNTKK